MTKDLAGTENECVCGDWVVWSASSTPADLQAWLRRHENCVAGRRPAPAERAPAKASPAISEPVTDKVHAKKPRKKTDEETHPEWCACGICVRKGLK